MLTSGPRNCWKKVAENSVFCYLSSSLLQDTQPLIFKTVLSSGYILILLSIEYILASLIEMCQG